MAFTYTTLKKTVFGNKRVHWGTFTNSVGSGTGGDIYVGMRSCEMLTIIPKGSAVKSNAPVVNETFPVTGSSGASAAVTIVTDAEMDGYWIAIGE